MSESGNPFVFDHDAFARSVPSSDYRRQIKRTVNGVPLSDGEVADLAEFVKKSLNLQDSDFLLDFGCGNGELLSLYARSCRAVGVDPSEFMIDVAKMNFETDRLTFHCSSTLEFLTRVEQPDRFTAAAFFASFQYHEPAEASAVVEVLSERFTGLRSVFLGNLPCLEKREYFAGSSPRSSPTFEHLTAIGRWMTMSDIEMLASATRFVPRQIQPISVLVGSHYRFHAILERC